MDQIRGMMRRPVASVCGETSLELLAAVFRRAALFVGNDGGPMHLAEALGVPLVALFGCTPLLEYGPRSRRVRVVRGPAPVPPCPQFEWCVTVTCPDHHCMRGITLEAVQQAVASALRDRDLNRDMRSGAPTVCAVGEPAGGRKNTRTTREFTTG